MAHGSWMNVEGSDIFFPGSREWMLGFDDFGLDSEF